MPNLIKNSQGQFVIETVLMMIVTLGIFMAAVTQLRNSNALAKLVEGPWTKVAGMIESGTWESQAQARANHPNQANRGVSYDPTQ